jgi:hypothetical protein
MYLEAKKDLTVIYINKRLHKNHLKKVLLKIHSKLTFLFNNNNQIPKIYVQPQHQQLPLKLVILVLDQITIEENNSNSRSKKENNLVHQ